jgi:sulfur relay (sulfurtransferase) DsrF/TusC family protein
MITKELLKEMIKDKSYIKQNNYFDFPHKQLDIFTIESTFIIETDMDAVTMCKQDLYNWATQWLRQKNLEKLIKS